MLTKEKIKSTIDKLPESFTVEEVIDRIILLDKIQQGLDDSEQKNLVSLQEMKSKLEFK
ncbi:MAG: hypothetical protein KDC09_04225 [Bacteroidales bacterium]|nr:hypothetical protein [Bacteroidales bacterium]